MVIFRQHAYDRMYERGIAAAEVRAVLATGTEIETYPDDTPYPRRLLLGYTPNGPLHVVVADDPAAGALYVVTVYRPSLLRWESDWRTRRRA